MVDSEPRIYYNRSGNLSQQTRLNEPVATTYMHVADMRRPISIIDSDKLPESDVVAVSSDTLAARKTSWIPDPAIIKHKSPLFTLEQERRQATIHVHERIIDDQVRKAGYDNRSDYNEKFLQKLNQAVKGGLKKSLYLEKLGFRDQELHYLAYTFLMGLLVFPTFRPDSIQHMLLDIGTGYTANVLFNLEDYSQGAFQKSKQILPPYIRKDIKEIFLPTIPIDKYIHGRLYLAQHGRDLITPQ